MGRRPGEGPFPAELLLQPPPAGVDRGGQCVQFPDRAVLRAWLSRLCSGGEFLHRLRHPPGQVPGQSQQYQHHQEQGAGIEGKILPQGWNEHAALDGHIVQLPGLGAVSAAREAAVPENSPVFSRQFPVKNSLGLPDVGQPPGHVGRAVLTSCTVTPRPRGHQRAAQLQVAQHHGVGGLPLQLGLHHQLRGAVGVDQLDALHPQGVPLLLPAGEAGIGAIPIGGAVRRIEGVACTFPVGHHPLR